MGTSMRTMRLESVGSTWKQVWDLGLKPTKAAVLRSGLTSPFPFPFVKISLRLRATFLTQSPYGSCPSCIARGPALS